MPYADKNLKVFLQGSYGNDMNIYAESDVDIVIRLDDCSRGRARVVDAGPIRRHVVPSEALSSPAAARPEP